MTEAARNALAAAHMTLVRRIASRVIKRLPASVEIDDLVGAGALKLVQIAGHYDATRGTSFEAFASRYVRGAMIDANRRRHYRNSTCETLDAVAHVGAWPDHDERIDAERVAGRVRNALSVLPARERQVIVMIYRGGETHRRIGLVIGRHGNRVGQIHRAALTELRRELAMRHVQAA